MDYISKNKLGCLTALFLVVLLCQSQVFNFFIDSVLGRSFLLLLILLIAYTNKILGTVVVFIIIIIFSGHNLGFTEGFDKKDDKDTSTPPPATNEPSTPATSESSTPATTTTITDDKKEESKPVIAATEGFDIVSKERTIQKGKQSNQIPVNDSIRSTNYVLPYETGMLSAFINYM